MASGTGNPEIIDVDVDLALSAQLSAAATPLASITSVLSFAANASRTSSFALHRDTIDDDLRRRAVTRSFLTSTTEDDFVRMRSKRHAPLVAATMFTVVVLCVWEAVVRSDNFPSTNRSSTASTDVLWQGAAPFLAASAVALLAGVVIVAKHVRRLDSSADRNVADRELAAALLLERIGAAAAALIGITLGAGTLATRLEQCSGDHGLQQDATCLYDLTWPAVIMFTNSFVLAPRIPLLAASNFAVLVATVAAVAVTWHTRVDVVLGMTAVLVSLGIGFTLAAIGNETSARSHFVCVVMVKRSNRLTVEAGRNIHVIIAAALPPELLSAAATPACEDIPSQHARHASVGIVDIHSFAEWSTGHLVDSVVHILHALLTTFDCLVAQVDGIERAMTYGDCYVVSSGLLHTQHEHGALMMQFVCTMREQAAALSFSIEHPFAVRCAVCSGPLVGGIVGGAEMRYVVSGPAMGAAKYALDECGPNGVMVTEVAQDVVAAFMPSDDAVLPLEQSNPHHDGHLMSDGPAAEEATKAPTDVYDLSAVWLTFRDPLQQSAMALHASAPTAASRFTAWVPVVFLVAAAATVVAEHLWGGAARQHALLEPAGVYLLCGATVAAVTRLVLQQASCAVPLAVDAALTVAMLAVASASFIVMRCESLRPSTAFLLALAFPPHLHRLPWLAQLALQTAAVVVPSVVWHVLWHGAGGMARNGAFLGVRLALAAAFFVAYRYAIARTACASFVVQHTVSVANQAATAALGRQQALLAGLVPPHAVCTINTAALARNGALARTHMNLDVTVYDVNVLQVRLFKMFERGIDEIALVWRSVAGAVKLGGGGLEIVQATGDVFLVAGPFVHSDALRLEGSQCVLRLLLALHKVLKPLACFKAVATAGSAHSALLGASQLTYRLFGPAVRENNAILAAAPNPGIDEFVPAKNVAFSSMSFRRQQNNYGIPGRLPAASQPAVSFNMSAGFGPRSTTSAVAPAPAEGGSGLRATDVELADIMIGPKMMWRVRGIGATAVSAITLD
jgi:hypothetical protein